MSLRYTIGVVMTVNVTVGGEIICKVQLVYTSSADLNVVGVDKINQCSCGGCDAES